MSDVVIAASRGNCRISVRDSLIPVLRAWNSNSNAPPSRMTLAYQTGTGIAVRTWTPVKLP
jgi:hypothetical protein